MTMDGKRAYVANLLDHASCPAPDGTKVGSNPNLRYAR
jgi:hypothetical protein